MGRSKRITAVKGVTAHQVTERPTNNLLIRIISAVVLIPPVLAATYLGYPYFNILIAAAVAAMAWEWSRLVNNGRFDFTGWILAIGLLAAVIASSLGAYLHGFLGLVLIGVVFFSITSAKRLLPTASEHLVDQSPTPDRTLWMAAGALYVGVPSLSLIWIRTDWDNGLLAVIWLLVLVWAADSGAYAAGRLIGGPKMAPRISPNKTWAGLGGGIIAAAGAGGLVAQIADMDGPETFIMLAVSALIGLISQGGDLVESAAKRYFDVKDTSNIIPGHGGVLDRLDALLAAIAAAALISLSELGALML